MTQTEFDSWCAFHVDACGATDGTLKTLVANQEIICGDSWRTSLKELRLATQSLVAHNRTPQFPSEHMKAVGLELIFLRDSLRRDVPRPEPVECPTCGGHGLVTVPMPRCVWHGRLVTYRRDTVDYGYVATCFVICGVCPAGRAESNSEDRRMADATEAEKRRRGRMPTLAEYTRNVGGADGVELLREHEASLARSARSGMTEHQRNADFIARYPGLARRLGAAREPEEATV